MISNYIRLTFHKETKSALTSLHNNDNFSEAINLSKARIMDNIFDKDFFLPADKFFKRYAPQALTYDDISLATQYSAVLPKQTKPDTSLSATIKLSLPIISSDMDTVTESQMAIAMARNGGLGLIHYNMDSAQQESEVARVKNYIHGLIQEPIKVSPDQLIGDVLQKIEERKYRFRTFPVVDKDRKLVGLLPGSVVKERYASMPVSKAMTPRSEVFTITQKELGKNPIEAADKFFTEHFGVHKLLVVDNDDKLCGLFTLSDIERILEEHKHLFKPARDSKFRLICGAAVAPIRKPDGSLDEDRIITHIGNMVDKGLDVAAVSTAHGFTEGVGDIVQLVRRNFKKLTIIAGNVTSAAGVEFLAKKGADAIKVGQGPGSICTTRMVAGVGIPQLTALYVCSKQAKKSGVKIIADGGITKSGDMVKALTLADAMICGGLLAGCPEAPGQIMEINGKTYKQYRGMGSLSAMKAGSAARYGHDVKDKSDKITAEGVEALKEVSIPLDDLLAMYVGGIQSGMGYLGAKNLDELKKNARYVLVSDAGRKEAAPHDIIEVKTAK